MTPVEVQALVNGLVQGQAIWYVLAACIGGLASGAGAYLAEKGKGRATKEDIQEITEKVEDVKATYLRQIEDLKAEYVRQLEDIKAHHQLRTLVAERRIAAHQEAYAHSVAMIRYAHTGGEKLAEVVTKARDWYDSNCLFLGKETRRSFNTATLIVEEHHRYLEQRVDASIVSGSWERIVAPLEHVAKEVELPPFSALELEAVRNGSQKGKDVSPA